MNPNIDLRPTQRLPQFVSTKFGIIEDEVRAGRKTKDMPGVKLVGIACHIGSQITDLQPLGEAAEKMANFALELKKRATS